MFVCGCVWLSRACARDGCRSVGAILSGHPSTSSGRKGRGSAGSIKPARAHSQRRLPLIGRATAASVNENGHAVFVNRAGVFANAPFVFIDGATVFANARADVINAGAVCTDAASIFVDRTSVFIHCAGV